MIVLGIDTSTPQVSVALGTEQGTIGRIQLHGQARQESVTPALDRLLGWTGLSLDRVGGVAVGVGPGLFTGLRVGVQTAKTLAQTLGVPIVAIGSLDALATTQRHTGRVVAAVIDGRRGEVFSALYRPVPGGVLRLADPVVQPPDHLSAEFAALGEDVLAVGDGAILYADVLAREARGVEFASATVANPDAAVLVELAAPRLLREEHDRLADVVPMYLRKSDAEISWDRRAGHPDA